MNTKIIIFSIIICSVFLVSPHNAMAATTAQIVNNAVIADSSKTPHSTHGEITFLINERPLIKGGSTNTGKIHMTMTQRTVKSELMSRESEGRFVIDQIVIQSSNPTEENIDSLEPIAIQWKTIGTNNYFRIENLPTLFVDALKETNIDLSTYIGQWISFDSKELLNKIAEQTPLSTIADHTETSLELNQLRAISKLPFFTISRVEKRWTMDNGHKMLRVRVRINPALINALQRHEISKIDSKALTRKNEIQEINKKFTSIRRFIANTQFVVEVNQTANSLSRIEFGGKQSETQKTCTWNNRYQRSICRNTSIRTITYSGGFSFMPDTGPDIEAPLGAITIQELINTIQSTIPAQSTILEGVSPDSEK